MVFGTDARKDRQDGSEKEEESLDGESQGPLAKTITNNGYFEEEQLRLCS